MGRCKIKSCRLWDCLTLSSAYRAFLLNSGPRRIFFASPDERITCPYTLNFPFFIVKRSCLKRRSVACIVGNLTGFSSAVQLSGSMAGITRLGGNALALSWTGVRSFCHSRLFSTLCERTFLCLARYSFRLKFLIWHRISNVLEHRTQLLFYLNVVLISILSWKPE